MSRHMLDTLRRVTYRADPGLQRTTAAGRTTISVALALAVALPLARALGQPMPLAVLAVSVAMNTSGALTEPGRIARFRTLGLAALIAGTSVALGLLLSGTPFLSRTAFVGIMAAGAWASGFGPRGITLGMLAFTSFFFTLFVRLAPAQLSWTIGAAALGVGVAGLVGITVLVPPGPRLRHLIGALRYRVAELMLAATGDHRARPEARSRTLRRATVELDQILVQVHDLLAQHPHIVPDERGFHRRLFAVVTLSHYLLLRVESPDAARSLHPPPADPVERLDLHLRALEQIARGEVPVQAPPAGAVWLQESDVPREEPLPGTAPAPAPARPRPWRSAVQAGVAGALAIVAGLAVAPERWYWAAMSAFVVLVNTPTRGATLRKGVERVLGTALGAAAGLSIAAVLSNRTGLELMAILPLVFTAFWTVQISYAAMVTVFTILVAIMYDMMGRLTVAAMAHRLFDTIVGASIGVAIAHVIVPARNRVVVDVAFRNYLDAMRGLHGALEEAAQYPARADAAILGAARALDQSLGALRRTLRPLAWSLPGYRRALRRQLSLAVAARFWMHRAAARVLFHGAAPAGDAEEMTALRRADELLAELAEARRS